MSGRRIPGSSATVALARAKGESAASGRASGSDGLRAVPSAAAREARAAGRSTATGAWRARHRPCRASCAFTAGRASTGAVAVPDGWPHAHTCDGVAQCSGSPVLGRLTFRTVSNVALPARALSATEVSSLGVSPGLARISHRAGSPTFVPNLDARGTGGTDHLDQKRAYVAQRSEHEWRALAQAGARRRRRSAIAGCRGPRHPAMGCALGRALRLRIGWPPHRGPHSGGAIHHRSPVDGADTGTGSHRASRPTALSEPHDARHNSRAG
jgi:hypothetical protein